MTLFTKYSFRQKKLALVVVFVLLSAAAYKRSFSITLQQLDLNYELQIKRSEAETSVERLKTKQNELKLINQIVGQENVPNDKVQQKFLSFFEDNSQYLSVERMEEVYTFDHPDYTINTNLITFKGDYLSTIKFIYNLEKQFPFARIVSANLQLKTNRVSQKSELHTTILLQNFWNAGR
jgi:vacuolar-type H+-ATPase catalytic subunit A/Vma1